MRWPRQSISTRKRQATGLPLPIWPRVRGRKTPERVLGVRALQLCPLNLEPCTLFDPKSGFKRLAHQDRHPERSEGSRSEILRCAQNDSPEKFQGKVYQCLEFWFSARGRTRLAGGLLASAPPCLSPRVCG